MLRSIQIKSISLLIFCMSILIVAPALSQNEGEETTETVSEEEAVPENNQSNLQTGQVLPEEVGDWFVICNDGQGIEENRDCLMQQRIFAPNGEQAAIAEIYKIDNDPLIKAGVSILTPLGTNLRSGLRLTVDGEKPEKQYLYSYCRPDGCLVEAGIFGSEVERMKAGKVLQMSINAFNNPDPLVYEISLDGFRDAYDKL